MNGKKRVCEEAGGASCTKVRESSWVVCVVGWGRGLIGDLSRTEGVAQDTPLQPGHSLQTSWLAASPLINLFITHVTEHLLCASRHPRCWGSRRKMRPLCPGSFGSCKEADHRQASKMSFGVNEVRPAVHMPSGRAF